MRKLTASVFILFSFASSLHATDWSRHYQLVLILESTASLVSMNLGLFDDYRLLAVWRGLRAANPCWKGRLAPPEMFLGSAGKGRFLVPA